MKCFVIMPFARTFDPVYRLVSSVAKIAVPDTIVQCNLLKEIRAAGRITDDILRGINEAAFCIADVSGQNPNVMWETGYAMALGKPTILIGRDITALPFDLKSHRLLEYSPRSLEKLRPTLAEAIRQTLAQYELKGSGSAGLKPLRGASRRTITVTGTMAASGAVAARRLEQVLAPYLSENAAWLVGSVGVVDIAAARFLLNRNQKVVAVGYHRYDCAGELRGLIDKGLLGFVDASLEPVLKGLAAPNQRDALFCMRSDLVILLWDGRSVGTRDMIQYFQGQGIATLVAFI